MKNGSGGILDSSIEVRYDKGLDEQRTGQLLGRFGSLRAGVIGDVCLDAYWEADVTRSILSRETPHHTLPVVEERYSPGAAGNVAVNLKALGCGEVFLCSVVGRDWRGDLLADRLGKLRIDLSYLLVSEAWSTPAYFKHVRVGFEQSRQEGPRLDFQNYAPLPDELAAELAGRLDAMAERCDIIAVTDQLPCGVIGAAVRDKLAEWSKRGKIIVADSRENIGEYRHVIVKPNELEAGFWFASRAGREERETARPAEIALRLAGETGGACCMTLGPEGAIWADPAGGSVFVPARSASGPTDIVGAGDSFASALLCALGTGSDGPEAMAFAHLAAHIVIGKIGMTGTATPQEMMALLREPGGAGEPAEPGGDGARRGRRAT